MAHELYLKSWKLHKVYGIIFINQIPVLTVTFVWYSPGVVMLFYT